MQRYLAIVGILWLLTSTARANANAPRSEPVPNAPTTSNLENAGTSDAEVLFAEAQQLYQAGELNEALQKMLHCYERTHAVNVLHNIAVIYQELGDCPNSLEYFQRYVRETEDDGQRDSAQQQIDTLGKQCPAPTPAAATASVTPKVTATRPPSNSAPAPRVPAANAASPHSKNVTTVGWVALGAGILAGASATYFALEALDAQRDTRNAKTSSVFDDRSSALARNSALAGILGAASLLAFGLGTYALIIASDTERGSAAFMLSPIPNGASVDCRMRF